MNHWTFSARPGPLLLWPGKQRRRAQVAGACLLVGVAAAALAAAPDSGAPDAQPPTAPETKLEPAPIPRRDALLAKPPGATVELFLKLQERETLRALLLRGGATKTDSVEAAALLAEAVPAGFPEDAEVAVLLGADGPGDSRRLERVSVEASKALKLIVGRDRDGGLRLVREGLSVDASPRRFQGKVGTSPFWSLRAAGVPADAARDYLEALSTRLDLARDVRPDDRFELVVDHWRRSNGESGSGPLLYAGLHRPSGYRLHLVRWTVAGRPGWFEPGKDRQRVGGLERPVAGSVSSRFGYRIHPILRIGRFHDGVDYRARWGSPVVAASEGAVVAAGWNGGHGRQVRLAHAGGLSTSYSHLSRIAAVPGAYVRQGQVIGYVGSTGFSTGPHLHFEVRQDGRPVDPLGFRHSTVATISDFDRAALQARLRQLRS